MASSEIDLLLRWESAAPAHIPLLKRLNPTRIVNAADSPVLREAGFTQVRDADLGPVITDGLWPGIRRPGARIARDNEAASASAEPWVDSNGHLIAYYRAVYPDRPAILAYKADEKAGVKSDVEVPFGTVELALVEARVAGGNIVLDLPARYREKLIAGDPKALEAWGKLKRTRDWLDQNARLMGNTPLPQVIALVEPGMPTRELSNLLHRRGVSPLLWNAAKPLPANPGCAALVAASLKQMPRQCYDIAEAGAILVIDQPIGVQARLTREEADRKFYSYGQGTIVAYNRRVIDPSEFALDVIDLITQRRRATRLWNAPAVIPWASQAAGTNEAILNVISYGNSVREDVQAHIQGHYTKAQLLHPEAPPEALKVAKRGPSTEIFIANLDRVATVRFFN
jgi:hypothetical protein